MTNGLRESNGYQTDPLWPRLAKCAQGAMRLTDRQTRELTPAAASWELPEWDSLAHMRLIAGLELEFDLMVTEDEAAEFTSLSAILDALTRHASEPQG